MKIKLITMLSIAAIAQSLLVPTASAVDLLARYPTQLTAGDAEPGHARKWEFNAGDIFHLPQFTLNIGGKLKVEMGSADLGIGHCADGAVWAVLIPRTKGTLVSSAADGEETINNVWLRFHPALIKNLFPSDTVAADGDTNLMGQILAIAGAKINSSWQSGGNVMIPDPEDMTVYVDITDGSRRFFDVNTQAQTADYSAAFNRRSSHPTSNAAGNQISATSIPPVVVKTIPESGSDDISPGECEIKITFSKEMADGSWSWASAWKDSDPESLGKPHYEADHKTCVMKVKLEPGKTYGYWINSQNFHNFKDAQGHPAIPYLIVFKTKSQ